MTFSVYQAELGIHLNLSLPDLGHPELPGLWEMLRADDRPPTERGLLCPECLHANPRCPEAMVLVERDGRRFARHYNPSLADHDNRNESDQHKAFKERIAAAAELGGHAVEVEDRAEDGRRRTDVLVKGDGDLSIGWEVQLSYASLDSVRKRSRIARDARITPSWMVVERTQEFINRVPWTLADNMDWQHVANGRELLIRGGVRALRFYDCDSTSPVPCPVKKVRRCGKRHPIWDPITYSEKAFQLDDLVRKTAAGEFVSVVVPGERVTNRWWVRAVDREMYLDAGGVLLTEDDPRARRAVKKTAEVDPQPFDPACRYGEDSGYRSPPTPIQDSPDAVVTAVTVHTHGCRALDGSGDGRTRCGKPARLYLCGYRCEEHKS